MKERTNEETLELFADLLEPFGELLTDDEVKTTMQGGKILKAVSIAIKKHKSAVIEILARIDGEEPSEYKVKILTIPKKLIELFSNPEILDLFTAQPQTTDAAFSGSATENTGDGVK